MIKHIKYFTLLIISLIFTYFYTKFLLSVFGLLVNFSQEGVFISGSLSVVSLVFYFKGIGKGKDLKKQIGIVYLMQGIFLLPPIIIYGIFTDKGLFYIFSSMIVFIFLPVIPLSINSMINLIEKSIMRIFAKILFLAVIILSYGAVYSIKFNISYFIKLFNEGNNSLALNLTFLFPFCDAGSLSLIYGSRSEGKEALLLMVLVSLCVFCLYKFLTSIKKEVFAEKL